MDCIVNDPRDFWTPPRDPTGVPGPLPGPPGRLYVLGRRFLSQGLILPLNWHSESEKGLLDSPLDSRGDLLQIWEKKAIKAL